MRGLKAGASAALAALLACSAPASGPQGREAAALPELGLMGTIPIYWGESARFGDLLGGKGQPHWARAELERSYRLEPVDMLDDAALAKLDYLLLAQPRALSPAENVALDKWVRGGGKLLLFADPLMTGGSLYAIGDRRRPQDVILLSPILAHWGLELQFVEDENPGYATREIAGAGVPVNLPGRFVPAGAERDCTLAGNGLLARCTIEGGTATILADAAVLDPEAPRAEAASALKRLMTLAFGRGGDRAGKAA
jgi:hypothetical protein